MTEPTVELHDGRQFDVLDIAIGDRAPLLDPSLTMPDWESVRPLDPHQIAPLQHRVRAGRDIAQDRAQELPMPEPGPRVQRGHQPSRRRQALLAGVSDDGHGTRLAVIRRGDVEYGMLQAHALRSGMGWNHVVEVTQPMDLDARKWVDPTRLGDGHVDRRPLGDQVQAIRPTLSDPEGGLMRERRRRVKEDRCPGALEPRQLAGVVDVHPGVHPGPHTATKLPLDECVRQPEIQNLGAIHQARLFAE